MSSSAEKKLRVLKTLFHNVLTVADVATLANGGNVTIRCEDTSTIAYIKKCHCCDTASYCLNLRGVYLCLYSCLYSSHGINVKDTGNSCYEVEFTNSAYEQWVSINKRISQRQNDRKGYIFKKILERDTQGRLYLYRLMVKILEDGNDVKESKVLNLASKYISGAACRGKIERKIIKTLEKNLQEVLGEGS